MNPRSLRLRLALTSAVAILAALAVAGVGLVLLFERQVERRVEAELDTFLDQLAAQIAFDDTGAPLEDITLADRRFETIFGGLYWRLLDETTGRRLRSRSLWDKTLEPAGPTPAPGEALLRQAAGPMGSTLMIHERRLIVMDGDREHVFRIGVAIDRKEVDLLTESFAWDVTRSLLLLALFLSAAAMAQARIGLRPLEALRLGVAAIRSGEAARIDPNAPSEVAPLVEELNALLLAQEQAARRARERAADLAHGFKTPLTSLKTDVGRLRKLGQTQLADDIEHTTRAMQRQIERELARSRLRSQRRAPSADPAAILGGLARTLKRTPEGETVDIEISLAPGLMARMEPDDLADVLGNLLENAVRHAKTRVIVRGVAHPLGAEFVIEDDGPGVPEDLCAKILARGARLDSSGAGAGIGLAIVRDLLEHYDATLSLGRSELSGLRAGFIAPAEERGRTRPSSGRS